ncbi:TrbG/VirB9 family P-type conjugative transfer protein [Cognatiyoonia sp. IB215182]|uniref:TrbG/VirB9 family P-type conjugative transfer protein n=1 Tax=Cognatiyoonia sp. IB215182 TaxID=3097353 RepID=UPI002A0D9952|nr:TrbG/VirB9 family P-type conjugative transfer protein [Cognatiyoonia sp. IB215182]MDX8355391.1 TrbG/VirB9 family P-type conjugative transfer protein [Cognatiyoonia sp. IB215182]
MMRNSFLISAVFAVWCGHTLAQETPDIDLLTQEMAAEIQSGNASTVPDVGGTNETQSEQGGAEEPDRGSPEAETADTAPVAPVIVTQPMQAEAAAPPQLTQEELTSQAADNWMDRTTSVGMGSVGRLVQTYDGSIARLVCQTEFVCNVEFEAGEKFSDTPILGDPVRWIMTPRLRTSPDGTDTQYLAIKPAADAQTTTLTVYTDRRIYPIMLVPSRTSHTHILAYSYPDTREREMREHLAAQAAAAEAQKASAAAARAAERHAAQVARAAAVRQRGVETTQGAVPAEDLDFNYNISGNGAFRPLRVYTDGQRTYIDLPDNYRGETPVLLAGTGQSNGVVNVRVSRDRRQLIADRSLSNFSLQVGRTRIRISKR